MSVEVHASAVVHPDAQIGEGVSIGPYAVIGEHVTLGDGCLVGPHTVIEGRTTIGRNNKISAGAVVGSKPQDIKYASEASYLEIGDNNRIREFATISSGTGENGRTVIGDNNMIMAYGHVAHNCRIGSNVVMANLASLAGHVTVEDMAVLGGMTGIHQFVSVGKIAMVGGFSKVVKDVLPFSMVDGHPARFYGLNSIGLKRNGIPESVRRSLKAAFKLLYRSSLNTSQALERIKSELEPSAEVDHVVRFVECSSRGICR